jgi:hypothetical protein
MPLLRSLNTLSERFYNYAAPTVLTEIRKARETEKKGKRASCFPSGWGFELRHLPMNLKIASLIINDLRILRLQGFKARKRFRRILTPTLSAKACFPPTSLNRQRHRRRILFRF